MVKVLFYYLHAERLEHIQKQEVAANSSLNLITLAARIAEERNALQPIALDVSSQTSLCSYVLIVSCKTKALTRALAGELRRDLYAEGYDCKGCEGLSSARWILLDYDDVIIHVMHQPERDFYQLESIWRKAIELEL